MVVTYMQYIEHRLYKKLQ